MILFPVVIKSLETIGREANGGCGCEIQSTGVKEVKESVLENLYETSGQLSA